MFIKILLALVAIVAVFLLVVAVQPSSFRVARSTTIDAPANVVFDQINDLHKWQEWSPWAKLDPLCKVSYSGPVAGKDAAFSWSGNDEVGEGTMTVIDSRPGELVKFRLDFVKPFKGTNEAQFDLEPQENQTSVTWTMTGQTNFVMKAIGLFMSCDKMMGPQFEKGLGQLKSVSEGASSKAP